MRIYPTFFNIFFKGMDPEKAHHVGFWGVQTLRNVGITRALRKYFQPAPELATTVMGITFPSPFGLAAGFDKGGKGIAALAGIGFGHVEIGTITDASQVTNNEEYMAMVYNFISWVQDSLMLAMIEGLDEEE